LEDLLYDSTRLHHELQVGLTTTSSAQPSPLTSPPAAAHSRKFPSLLRVCLVLRLLLWLWF
jgi:hypothetical protein